MSFKSLTLNNCLKSYDQMAAMWRERCSSFLMPGSGYILLSVMTVICVSDCRVINCCCDSAERHERLHTGPRPVIACCLSWLVWCHHEGGLTSRSKNISGKWHKNCACVKTFFVVRKRGKLKKRKKRLTSPFFYCIIPLYLAMLTAVHSRALCLSISWNTSQKERQIDSKSGRPEASQMRGHFVINYDAPFVMSNACFHSLNCDITDDTQDFKLYLNINC